MTGTRVVVLCFKKNRDDIVKAVLTRFIFNEKFNNRPLTLSKTYQKVPHVCNATHKHQKYFVTNMDIPPKSYAKKLQDVRLTCTAYVRLTNLNLLQLNIRM